MIRAAAFVGIPLAATAWFTGLMDFKYKHVVSAGPDVVAERLDNLDFADAPGSGGNAALVSTRIRHERTADGLVWTVTSRDQVAMRFYADLKPVDNGTKTEVTTRAERGDAPDDIVVPMFREKGIALGLFTSVVEGRLAETVISQRSREWCRDFATRMFEAANSEAMAKVPAPRDGSLGQAFAQTSKDVLKLSAMRQELQNQGCAKYMNENGGFPT